MTPPVQPNGGQPPAVPGAPVQQGAAMLTGQELNLRIRHGDPAYPPELWGKTLGEAMRYYSVMRQDFMVRNAPQQQPQQPPPQAPYQRQPVMQPHQQPQGFPFQQPAPIQQPNYGGYQAPQQPQQPQGFDEGRLGQLVQDAVSQALGPVQQVSAQNVYQQVRSRFPDWAQYDAEIQMAVSGASPQQLLNPQMWESAYFFVKGRVLSDPNRQQQPQYAPQGDPFGRPMNGAIQTPPPSVFTESSIPQAPGNPGGPGGGNQEAFSPHDIEMARRFGIPVEEYRAWKGGRVPPPPQPQAFNGGMQGQPAPQVPYAPAQNWR